ncbi:MAG TPA: acyl-CoA desaturase [Haliscomenobacter sp.]|uniref:fatty acid desaturase family protein n=1 Tax=Haliscomenobacter sp. TaxID=2717303 RepID=UPI002C36F0A2|nr:acyl-CoA desaturase [Haliscomenobacter sp.]HOY17918.1 acyl-CoA desaturase [Haliscomenobacter sp.]
MANISADTHASFKKALFERLNHYFEVNRLSKKGNWEMTLKVTFALAWWIGSYFLLYAADWTYPQFFGLYLLQGLGQIFMFLNIAHDANHNSISNNRFINKTLSYVLDACGISSYMWRVMHNKGHHSVMNVYGEDEGIFAHGIFRFSPDAPWRKSHRFQHIYVFFMYAITTLDFIFVKDFEYLFFKNNKHVENVKYPLSEWIIIIGSKIIYLTYMIALPVLILGFSVGQVVLAFLITHFIMGLVAAWIIQVAHLLDINEFPHARHDHDFVDHIFATTTDYATRSRIANFICGGLNHHVVHHIFPQVAHTHYPKLTKIVRETAAEFGVDYRENVYMYQAMAHHLKLLKQLGQPPIQQLEF